MIPRLSFVAVLLTVASALPFTGITYLGPSTITAYDAQYAMDSARVTTDHPIVDPDGCANADGTYDTDPTLAGSKLQQSKVLASFLANKKVAIAINDCGPGGHPRVWNVSVLQ